MKNRTKRVIISGLIAASLAVAASKPEASSRRQPVLLELFTSEGCSSCPPADRLLKTLDQQQPVDGADLIVLSEHVDYWNHDGWSDPYSSATNTARQQSYATSLALDTIYTPQLVVDGTAELVGSNGAEARKAISRAIRTQKIPISVSNAIRTKENVQLHLELEASPSVGKTATVYVAVADNEDRSQVAHGENAGKSLAHVAVVRTLVPVGTVTNFKKDVSIPLKAGGQSGLRVVAFIQDNASRKVLGVAQQKL